MKTKICKYLRIYCIRWYIKMGGGRGMGGEQAAQLFQQLQAALAERETQEGGGAGEQNNVKQEGPSFEECVSNVGLWLQVKLNEHVQLHSLFFSGLSPISALITFITQ
jgi:hypothetical protein